MWAFSSCRQQGLLSSYTTRASHCGGFSSCGAWAVGHVGSVLVAHRLSCSTACGSFLDQGSNPYPLHWQADSSPLSHQGSPSDPFFIFFFSSCFLFVLSLLCICFSVHMSLASCLITYYSVNTNMLTREIDGETVEAVSDFIFWSFKITADGDCSHENTYSLEGKL